MYELLVFIITWAFFYYILKYRNKRAPIIKATIIALLFMGLFYAILTNMFFRLNFL